MADLDIAALLDDFAAAVTEAVEARAVGDGDDEYARMQTRRQSLLLRLSAERDALRAQRDGLLALVERASTDSLVTDEDSGCFYCDHVEHTKRCPAAAAIRAAKGQP